MNEYMRIVLITFLAGFTQGLSGFGSILLSLPIFAIFLDIKTVIPLVALQGLFSAAGFLAGCLGGALGAAGPPVIVYTSLQPWAKDKIKATLQGFFTASGLVVVFLHALNGLTMKRSATLLWDQRCGRFRWRISAQPMREA